jgi:hypothetical protein
MIANYGMAGADGNPVSFETAVTLTLVHVKGKVLFLYATADRSDLEWSRQAAKEWAAAVIAANPSVGAIAEQENRGRGFDWNQVLTYGIVGGASAAVMGVLKLRGKKGT